MRIVVPQKWDSEPRTFRDTTKLGANVHLPLTLCVFILLCANGSSGAVLGGSILDRAGVPISNASVTLYGPNFERNTASNQEGKFEFTKLPDGEYDLDVTAPGFASAGTETVQIINNMNPSPVTFTLTTQPGCSIGDKAIVYKSITPDGSQEALIGTVTDENGRSLRATVVLSSRSQHMVSMTTDRNGRFRFAMPTTRQIVAVKVVSRGYGIANVPRIHIRPKMQALLRIRMHRQLASQKTICQ